MKALEFEQLLLGLEAWDDFREWAKGKSLYEAWTTCERGDWLLWLFGKMMGYQEWPTQVPLVLATCACAELSLKYIPDNENRPRIAIETARNWANGQATVEEVWAARDAAWSYVNGIAITKAVSQEVIDAASAAYLAAHVASYIPSSVDAHEVVSQVAHGQPEIFAQCATIVRRFLKPPINK